ncbi:MAG: hypothetical protein ACRCTQ_05680 [Brevinemataceae bacterium]
MNSCSALGSQSQNLVDENESIVDEGPKENPVWREDFLSLVKGKHVQSRTQNQFSGVVMFHDRGHFDQEGYYYPTKFEHNKLKLELMSDENKAVYVDIEDSRFTIELSIYKDSDNNLRVNRIQRDPRYTSPIIDNNLFVR